MTKVAKRLTLCQPLDSGPLRTSFMLHALNVKRGAELSVIHEPSETLSNRLRFAGVAGMYPCTPTRACNRHRAASTKNTMFQARNMSHRVAKEREGSARRTGCQRNR